MQRRDPAGMSEEELCTISTTWHLSFLMERWARIRQTFYRSFLDRSTFADRTKEAGYMLESLRDIVKEASDSSDKLASALDRFTRWLVIVGVIVLVLQAVSMGW